MDASCFTDHRTPSFRRSFAEGRTGKPASDTAATRTISRHSRRRRPRPGSKRGLIWRHKFPQRARRGERKGRYGSQWNPFSLYCTLLTHLRNANVLTRMVLSKEYNFVTSAWPPLPTTERSEHPRAASPPRTARRDRLSGQPSVQRSSFYGKVRSSHRYCNYYCRLRWRNGRNRASSDYFAKKMVSINSIPKHCWDRSDRVETTLWFW